MIETYFSEALKAIETSLKDLNDRIESNNSAINQSGLNIKTLKEKLDPSLEVFSPLKINMTLKKNIQKENEKIDALKEENKLTLEKIESLNKERLEKISMLASYREDKYKLEKYQNMNINKLLIKLNSNLKNSLTMDDVKEIKKINSESLSLVDEYSKIFNIKTNRGEE